MRDLVHFIEEEWPDGINYLPEDYSRKPLNRSWLSNLCNTYLVILYLGNTFNEEKFSSYVKQAIKEREERIIHTNSLEILTDNRIIEALQNSSFVSSNF